MYAPKLLSHALRKKRARERKCNQIRKINIVMYYMMLLFGFKWLERRSNVFYSSMKQCVLSFKCIPKNWFRFKPQLMPTVRWVDARFAKTLTTKRIKKKTLISNCSFRPAAAAESSNHERARVCMWVCAAVYFIDMSVCLVHCMCEYESVGDARVSEEREKRSKEKKKKREEKKP